MSKRQVVGSMSEWSGVLKDLFQQIDDGSVTLPQVQTFLEHRNPFEAKLDIEKLVKDWENFYQEVFGIKVDFYELPIPKHQPGFDRLIIVAEQMTPETLFNKCKELFPCWKWTDKNLDEIVESERTTKNGAYAIWVRDRVEADEELKNLSANDSKKQDIPGITLEERLLYELKYFRETSKHLDVKNLTLCAGSRDDGGGVPGVSWDGVRLGVYWCPPDDRGGSLRSRQVVS